MKKYYSASDIVLPAIAISGMILMALGIVAGEMVRSDAIKGYDEGIKNHISCSRKDYKIKKHRSDIIKFEFGDVYFKGGFVARTIDCHWLDHYSDDYSKLKELRDE